MKFFLFFCALYALSKQMGPGDASRKVIRESQKSYSSKRIF